MTKVLMVVLAVLLATPCLAQDTTNLQGKTVFHAPVPAEPGWYPTGWSITNFRENATDNTNIMVGVGRKLEKGWIEIMAMRQYSIRSNQWFVDFRFNHQLPEKFGVFIEISPFLETKALYTFGRLDRPVFWRLNAVLESENVHREGKDSWGVGPGISIRPMKLIGRMRFAPVMVWQIRPNDPDFVRFYFGFPL
jgi:hypothetical protein